MIDTDQPQIMMAEHSVAADPPAAGRWTPVSLRTLATIRG
jgi:hypothetical protein